MKPSKPQRSNSSTPHASPRKLDQIIQIPTFQTPTSVSNSKKISHKVKHKLHLKFPRTPTPNQQPNRFSNQNPKLSMPTKKTQEFQKTKFPRNPIIQNANYRIKKRDLYMKLIILPEKWISGKHWLLGKDKDTNMANPTFESTMMVKIQPKKKESI